MISYHPGRWFITQPYEQIVGFRNLIIYGYDDVDRSILWTIVQNEAPRLLKESEAFLNRNVKWARRCCIVRRSGCR